MKIKIIKTPPGEAPEWVRKAWVDLTLVTCEVEAGPSMGARSGKPENGAGHTVWAMSALSVLRLSNKMAARWWTENVQNVEAGYLVFAQDVCESAE